MSSGSFLRLALLFLPKSTVLIRAENLVAKSAFSILKFTRKAAAEKELNHMLMYSYILIQYVKPRVLEILLPWYTTGTGTLLYYIVM